MHSNSINSWWMIARKSLGRAWTSQRESTRLKLGKILRTANSSKHGARTSNDSATTSTWLPNGDDLNVIERTRMLRKKVYNAMIVARTRTCPACALTYLMLKVSSFICWSFVLKIHPKFPRNHRIHTIWNLPA